jgi:HSP20 family protein
MAIVPVRRETSPNYITRLRDEMDDLIQSFFSGADKPLWPGGRWPAVDVAETDEEFIVKAEVPGCKPEDIDISVHGSTLTISGEKKQEKEEKTKGYYHAERSYGQFQRHLNLGSDVNPGKIDAVCKNGVLTITLAKSEKSKPTKIKVKS